MAESNHNALVTITDMDALTQSAADGIVAMTKAAQRMLELDAASLIAVANLLDEICARAQSLTDDINIMAEKHGANWEREHRELSERLWKQHHELHQTGK